MTRRYALVVGFAAAAMLTVASCGSGGGSDSSATTAPSTTAAPSSTTDPATPPETATTSPLSGDPKVDATRLSLEDLPAGWESSPYNEQADNLLSDCFPTFGTGPDTVAHVLSPELVAGQLGDGGGGAVNSHTVAFQTEAAATAAVDTYLESETVACLDEGFKALLARHFTGAEVTGEMAAEPVAVGDQGFALEASYVVSGGDLEADEDFTLDIRGVRVGSTVGVVRAVLWGDARDPALPSALADTVASRMSA